MIDVQHLVREYEVTSGVFKRTKKSKIAVNDISFHVNQGEIFSILGPNGAGKTTTIKILSTLLAPTSGTVSIMGMDVWKDATELRSHINFIFGGESGVYRRISGKENLLYFASLYHIHGKSAKELVSELLQLVRLEEAQNQKVEEYSKGMIQRLQIARGLLNDPKVVYLDEPTIGLDPVGARDLKNLIFDLKQRGKTIILTTHDMEEADQLSDRIAFIKNGKIIALDTAQNLKQQFKYEQVLDIIVRELKKESMLKLKEHPFISFINIKKMDDFVHIQIQYKNHDSMTSDIIKIIGVDEVRSIQPRNTRLEDVYLRIMESE